MPLVSPASAHASSAGSAAGHYENFPVASWLCPPPLRPAVRAFYWYARTADDLADEGEASATQRLNELAAYRAALSDALEGRVDPAGRWAAVFAPLVPLLQTKRLKPDCLLHLLDAFEQDVRHTAAARGYATRAELLAYCARSANPVGRTVLHLCGVSDAQALAESDDICSALQLINFWQDVSQDLARGRYYLPHSDLLTHGMEPGQPDTWARAPRRQALMADLCNWSRGLMLRGSPLVHRLPGRMGWELRLVVQGGLRVLDRLASCGHDSFHYRPKLGKWDAVVVGARALGMPKRSATIGRT